MQKASQYEIIPVLFNEFRKEESLSYCSFVFKQFELFMIFLYLYVINSFGALRVAHGRGPVDGIVSPA